MNAQDIAALVSSFVPAKVLVSGVKAGSCGKDVPFEIKHGWDIHLAHKCDSEWGRKNIEIIRFIKEASSSDEELNEKCTGLHMEDAHWRWTAKAIHHNAQEYNWFFFVAENMVQGACLIYHPKDSIIDGQGIFYIEYVAVAPWNRPNPVAPALFRGVGSDLIRHASKYAGEVLGLRPGFSLHSLPKAATYYRKIGMVCYPERKKDSLEYYEMAKDVAQAFGVIQNA